MTTTVPKEISIKHLESLGMVPREIPKSELQFVMYY